MSAATGFCRALASAAIGFGRRLGPGGGGGSPHQHQRREHDDRRGVYHSPLGPST
jgi:hypothetical protein